MNQWRGRTRGLAIPGVVAAASALFVAWLATIASGLAPSATPAPDWQLVARATDGDVLLRVSLPDGRFTLRYRNSVYGSLAEERFAIRPDGRMELVELAADEPAVLDEYYVTADSPRLAEAGDTRRWQAAPAEVLQLAELPVAATRLGERTLVAEGQSVPLWQLPVADGQTVILRPEEAR